MRAFFVSLISWVSPVAISGLAAVIVVFAGIVLLVLAGLDSTSANRLWSGPVAVSALVFGGVALALLRDEQRSVPRMRIGSLGGMGVSLIGIVILLAFAATQGQAASQRPSFHAGAILTLIGLALASIDLQAKRGPRPSQFQALLAFLVAAVALLGHVGGGPLLYSLNDAGVSAPIAALGAVLSFGVMCARPDTGFAGLLRARENAGFVARTLVLAPLVIPIGMGLVVTASERLGIFDRSAAGWIFQMAYFGGFTLIIWWVTSVIRRAEIETARHQEHFRAVAETAAQAVVSADRSGRITYLNPAAEQMFGYRAVELLGRPLASLLPERLWVDHQKEIERILTSSKRSDASHTTEGIGLRRGGKEFPIELSLASWRAESDLYFSAIISDIRERKEAEEALRTANQQMAAANQELEAFSYSVSHDLRAPLRAIHGFTRLLVEDYASQLPADAQEYLNDVLSNARQMGQLVDDLLAFSRLGKQPIKTQVVHSKLLVQQCLDEILADQKGRTVEVVVSDLPDCRGDPALLKQVWLNLLSNAWKYSRTVESARVEVGSEPASDDSETVTYFVRDNGVGFEMEYASKLFGVFQRLHRADEFEGTGVGLAIVQRVVQRHDGRVWADAKLGKGATFYFTLSRSQRG